MKSYFNCSLFEEELVVCENLQILQRQADSVKKVLDKSILFLAEKDQSIPNPNPLDSDAEKHQFSRLFWPPTRFTEPTRFLCIFTSELKLPQQSTLTVDE